MSGLPKSPPKAQYLLYHNTLSPERKVLFSSVSLLLTSMGSVLLDHLLHAHTGRFIFCCFTLCFCGPVLNPGPLTEYIPIPEEEQSEKNTLALHVTSYLWHIENITRGTYTQDRHNKLTFDSDHPCKYLWMRPWWGRYGLVSDLMRVCSADNWGMCAVYP